MSMTIKTVTIAIVVGLIVAGGVFIAYQTKTRGNSAFSLQPVPTTAPSATLFPLASPSASTTPSSSPVGKKTTGSPVPSSATIK